MTRIIAISSGKGGVGKSTLSANLSLALRNLGQKVLLIDCNLSTPHLAYYLGTTNYQYTLNDALLNKVDIISAVNNYEGIRFVPASLDLNDVTGLEVAKFKKNLKKLIVPGKVDFVLLDSAPGLGREALVTMDASNEVIFVTTPFAPMINDVVRCRDVLKTMKGIRNMNVILNMVTYRSNELLPQAVSEMTGLPVLGEVPFDRKVINSLVTKTPVLINNPSSSASAGIKKIAAALTNTDYREPGRVRLTRRMAKWRNVLLTGREGLTRSKRQIRKEK